MYDKITGHKCSVCGKAWKASICGDGCAMKDETCPICSGWSTYMHDWKYLEEFEEWVARVRKEAGLV